MSAAIAAAADAMVADVERVYRDTEAGLSGWLTFGANSNELANLRATRPQIDSWKTTLRGFAARGRKDNGNAYSWEAWADHGKTLTDAMYFYAHVAADNGPFAAVKNAARAAVATVETVGQGAAAVANVGAWSTSTKLLIGGGIALLVLVQLRGLVR